jgi:hypothetical protein
MIWWSIEIRSKAMPPMLRRRESRRSSECRPDRPRKALTFSASLGLT